jgi:rubredoxin---NAD+ reductase
MMNIESSDTEQNGSDPIVVIGSGMAAYTLVKEFRKINTHTPLKIISQDDGYLYDKPGISSGLTNSKTPEELVTTPQKLKVDILPYTAVTSVDRQAKLISIDSETLAYSKLIFATGADVIRAPFEGTGLDHVHAVNDLLSYRKLRADLVGKAKVLIVGAGLSGCEFANDLLNQGLTVDIVESLGQCLPNILPKEVAAALENELTANGCTFHFETHVKTVDKTGNRLTVTLSNEEKLNTDLVISAIGLRPRIELAQRAGLATNEGIIVNDHLEASDPDIYAIGDCAEIEGEVSMCIGPILLSAEALAHTLAGHRTAVHFNAMPVVVKTPACRAIVVVPRSGATGQWVIESDSDSLKAVFKDETGNNLGFVLVGDYINQGEELRETLPPIVGPEPDSPLSSIAFYEYFNI